MSNNYEKYDLMVIFLKVCVLVCLFNIIIDSEYLDKQGEVGWRATDTHLGKDG